MIAYLVLLLAVVSRVVPHSWNVTAVGGSLLYFGARRPRWQAAIATLVLAATDFYLTHFVYSYPFLLSNYAITWLWYAGVCLLGYALLSKKTSTLRVAAAVFTSATSFFLISNFAVWLGLSPYPLYPHTFAGLAECYTIALPFYGNDLVSTALVAGALFGLPALARKLSGATSHGSTTA
jgi:hypothetical protein